MDKKLKIKICVYTNLLLIIGIILSFFIFNDYKSRYFRFGWSEDFTFVSFIIDTPIKYLCLCFFIILVNISDVLINDVAQPILYFTTYNPDRPIITDFSRFELQMYSNIMLFIQTLKKFLQVLITISQIDIAFISIISSQISGMLTINFLLNEKTFSPPSNIQINYRSAGYQESYSSPNIEMNYRSTSESIPLVKKMTLPV